MEHTGTITGLLKAWGDGEPDAMDQLMSLVYPRLRELAERRMYLESPGHTMRPTELVHEAYLKLVGQELSANDRGHFYAICAQAMRRILIDHAKAQLRAKRGGGGTVKALEGLDVADPQTPERMIEIHQALDQLAEFDGRKAQAVELCVFGGFEQGVAAEVLNISPATLRRELKLAKAWLYRALH